MLTYAHQQPRRQQAYLYALNAVLSRNPARLVVAVALVLGFETVEVLVTQKFVTRGSKASWPARYGCSGSHSGGGRMVLSTLLMLLTWEAPKQSS